MLAPLSQLGDVFPGGTRVQDHWLVEARAFGMRRALLKIGPWGMSEICGYRLAVEIKAPVPRYEGVWVESTIRVGDEELGFGSLGVAVEWYGDWSPISRLEAAARDPRGFSRALVLCLFDRHEWGEFGRTADMIKFIDLENLFPAVDVENYLSVGGGKGRESLRSSVRSYLAGIPSEIEDVIEEAALYGVLQEFRKGVQEASALSDDEWATVFDLSPHPVGREMAPPLIKAARARLQDAIKRIEA